MIAFGLLVSVSSSLSAQNAFKSEEDLKNKASELFEDQQFIEATPLFAQLLSLYPKEPDYNFKYGACLLYSDADKSKALRYLAFSTSKPSVDNRAYFYAGKGYHLNYQFSKALKNYNRFKSKASSIERKQYEIDQQIAMVKSGNELLKSINSLDVISKESVAKEDFFRIYQMEGLNGKLVVKPDEFKSKYDRKNDENSIMFLPNDANEVYFSSYGKNGDNGRDIYKAVKLGNGKWSDAVNVGNSINTIYDEEFAFILPDGRTMYFASKGHNSIGGYDLFKSTFDESIGNWTAPVNLEFPYSTVNDDVMFLSNADQSIAYFASDRNNTGDQYYVYKVGTTPRKPDLFVIKGKFIAENIPNLKRAKITVVDAKTNETVGVYETDESGAYNIEVEQEGGEYKFNIETTDEAPIHSGIVKIPQQTEFTILGQELRLVGEEDAQKLVIKNIFDGTTNLADYGGGPIVSPGMLTRQANMNKNTDEAMVLARNLLESANTDSTPADATTTAKNEEVRASEVNQTQKEEKDLNQATSIISEVSKLEQQFNSLKGELSKSSSLLYADGYSKSNEALSFFKEAEKQLAIANLPEGEPAAELKYEEANRRGKQKALESKLALKYADDFTQRENEVARQHQIIINEYEVIKSFVELNDYEAANNALKKLKNNIVLSQNTDKSARDSQISIADRRLKLQQEISTAENTTTLIEAQLKVINDELESLETNLSLTKNKREISKIESRLKTLGLDKEDLSFEISKNKEIVLIKQNKLEELKYEELYLTKLANNQNEEQLSVVNLTINQKKSLRDNVSYFEANDLLFSTSSNVDSSMPLVNRERIDLQLSKIPDNSVFESRIKNANSVAVVEEKNLQLSEINKDWSLALNEKILLNEQLIKMSGSDEVSQLVAENISLLQLKNQKNKEAQDYIGLSNTLESSSNSMDEKFAQDLIEPAYNEGFKINLLESEAITDEKSKIESQIAIYEDWNELISSDINILVNKESLNGPSETTSQQITSLNSQRAKNLKILDELMDENLALQANKNDLLVEKDQSNSQLPTIKTDTKETVNAETNSINSSSQSINESSVDKNNTAESLNSQVGISNSKTAKSNLNTARGISYDEPQGTVLDDFSDLKYADDVTYSSNKSIQLLTEAESEKALAKQLLEQYEVARKEALTLPTAVERAEALAIADQIKAKSEAKQIEVNSLYSNANKYQYVQLNTELNNYPKFSQEFQSKSLDLADLLLNESEYYISEAQRLRLAVLPESRFTEKTVQLQKAYNYEVVALKKMEEARVALSQATVEYNNPSVKTVQPRKVAVIESAALETTDQNVLASREAQLAVAFRSQVDSIDAVIITLQNELAETKKQAYRDVIEADIITLTEQRDIKENQAVIYERREEQLSNQLADLESKREERLEAIFAEKKERNLLRGATKLNQFGVDAGEVDLTEEEYNTIKTNPSYITYSVKIQERNQLIKDANVLYEEMTAAKEANNTTKVASLDKMIRIKNLLAQKKEEEAFQSLAEVNSIESILMRKAGAMASGLATGSFEIKPELIASNVTPSENLATSNNDVDATKVDIEKQPTEVSTSKPTSAKPFQSINTSSETINSSVSNFKVTEKGVFNELNPNQSIYSKSNPIPIDVPLPDGIIYKVQVGAYRNPISQDLFKGFAPLMGEKVSNGIIRYTAGIFLDFSSADEAKKNIRALGYKDAFVVAFKDGKRVGVSVVRDTQSAGNESASVAEVRQMVRKFSVIEDNNTTNNKPESVNESEKPIPNSEGLPKEFDSENIAPVKNISVINGVYFTVQVGVYSKPISKGEINVPELAVKVIKDKLYRYSSGVYNDAIEAAKARDRIKKIVPDAFVIAYNNGTKISLEKALELMNQ